YSPRNRPAREVGFQRLSPSPDNKVWLRRSRDPVRSSPVEDQPIARADLRLSRRKRAAQLRGDFACPYVAYAKQFASSVQSQNRVLSELPPRFCPLCDH